MGEDKRKQLRHHNKQDLDQTFHGHKCRVSLLLSSVSSMRFLGWCGGEGGEGCQGRGQASGGGAIIARLTIGMPRIITIITLWATAVTTRPRSLAPNPFHLLLSPNSDHWSRSRWWQVKCCAAWRFLLPTIIILLSKYLPIIRIFRNKLYSFTIPARSFLQNCFHCREREQRCDQKGVFPAPQPAHWPALGPERGSVSLTSN